MSLFPRHHPQHNVNMPLLYANGEEIQKGDHVLYDGLLGEIEFIADPEALGAEDWYIQQFGGGVMVAEPTLFGKLFVKFADIDGRLVLVSRKDL